MTKSLQSKADFATVGADSISARCMIEISIYISYFFLIWIAKGFLCDIIKFRATPHSPRAQSLWFISSS